MTAMGEPGSTRGYDRRRFLTRIGLGAAVATGGGSLVTAAGAHGARAAGRGHVINTTSFTRLFPDLPPFSNQSPKVENALRAFGEPGGLLDAKDALSAGPVALITDPALSANNPNNPTHTAGTTFFGQFVDHDITFDVGSRLGQPRTHKRRSTAARPPSISTPSTEAGPSARRTCTTRSTTRS